MNNEEKFNLLDEYKGVKEEKVTAPPLPSIPEVDEENEEELKAIQVEEIEKVEEDEESLIDEETLIHFSKRIASIPEDTVNVEIQENINTFDQSLKLEGEHKGEESVEHIPITTEIQEPIKQVMESKPVQVEELKYGGIDMGSQGKVVTKIDFEGDDYLKNNTDTLYEVKGVNTLEIPLERKGLYQLRVNHENVEVKINNYFENNPTIVSFAIEQIGLNNRLLEMPNSQRDFTNFVLVRSKTGNIAVHKSRISNRGIEKQFMKEAVACVERGERIVVPLKETYVFTDMFEETYTRERFRASFGEIQNFIKETRMNGRVTRHGYLIINE